MEGESIGILLYTSQLETLNIIDVGSLIDVLRVLKPSPAHLLVVPNVEPQGQRPWAGPVHCAQVALHLHNTCNTRVRKAKSLQSWTLEEYARPVRGE